MTKLTDDYDDDDDRVSCRICGPDCCGPCHDFCSCRHCWNGWKQVPFLTRLRWRIAYFWRVQVVRRQLW